jgi:predicted transcriptional regulator
VMAFTVRLPEDIAEALQREAERRLSTPAEVLRTAVIHYLGKEQTPEAQHELLYEIAKTRSVLLRFLDKQLGEAVADQLLDVADGDARLYVQQRHPGG